MSITDSQAHRPSASPAVEEVSAVWSPRLDTLQHLLAIPTVELGPALREACALIAPVIGADTVEVFLWDPASSALVAAASEGRMSIRQRAIGFDRFSLTSGGLIPRVFRSGGSYITGLASKDPDERQDIVNALGIRSEMLCGLEVNGGRRGVLQATSNQENKFSQADLRFFEAASRWASLVMQRADLVDKLGNGDSEAERNRANDELRRLTPREREVAVLVADGLTNEEIGERLVIVPGTVSNHIEHILRKLGFTRRVQLATWAVHNGLWSPPSSRVL